MRRVFLATLAMATGLAQAQVFYAGDPFTTFSNQFTLGLSSEQNTLVTDSKVYERFTITTTTVMSGAFGHFILNGFTPATAYFELRTGMSNNNCGTLIAASISTVSIGNGPFVLGGFYPFTPVSGGTSFVQSKRISMPFSFVLAPGTYEFTLVPMGSGLGRAYALSTLGSNGIGGTVNDGLSWIDSTLWGFICDEVKTLLGSPTDFSLGIS